ncbi:hypothetical protein BLOT_014782 [Blomia tropicalis]|nr:hypothetical protein BLOT_014782 [Blomia tropicalis]
MAITPVSFLCYHSIDRQTIFTISYNFATYIKYQVQLFFLCSPLNIIQSSIVKCVADSNSVNRLMCGQLKFDRTLLSNFIYPFSKTFSTNVLAFTSCNDVIIIIQSL